MHQAAEGSQARKPRAGDGRLLTVATVINRAPASQQQSDNPASHAETSSSLAAERRLRSEDAREAGKVADRASSRGARGARRTFSTPASSCRWPQLPLGWSLANPPGV